MPLGENEHKADMALLEKYQGLTGELLRISLLAIAVLGFSFDKVASNLELSVSSKHLILAILGIAAIVFAFAAAASLAHRYYSSEEMYYRLRLWRRAQGSPEPLEGGRTLDSTLVESRESRDQLRKFLVWMGLVDRVYITNHEGMRQTSQQIAAYFLGAAAWLVGIASIITSFAFLVANIGFGKR
jgi:hypothetical protein